MRQLSSVISVREVPKQNLHGASVADEMMKVHEHIKIFLRLKYTEAVKRRIQQRERLDQLFSENSILEDDFPDA